jgi:hypothetical protein
MPTPISVTRRDFLRASAAAGGIIATSSFVTHVRAEETAAAPRKRNSKINHVILLFMEGGPSQLETFDLKPGKKTGAPYKPIETEVPGFQPAEHFVNIAKCAKDLCLIKSMSSREGNHSRAAYLLRTGYIPNPTLKHPSLGSIVAQQLGDPAFELPNFVKLRGGPFPAGYLGVENNPFVISRPGSKIENLDYAKGVDKERMDRRMKLVKEMEKDFAKERGDEAVEAHKAMYDKARALMDSPKKKYFYLDEETPETRKEYGEGQFADSCIIARRLIEAGVPAVEIVLGGWDTHDDGFNRCKSLITELDKPWAALINDLKKRGLWESTLVIWMGEFGRTPELTTTEGRGHWPQNFCTVLGGGSVKMGQVIGETDELGINRDAKNQSTLKDPVSPADLYKTIGTMMDWDMNKEFEAGNRPVWLTDKEAKVCEKIYK